MATDTVEYSAATKKLGDEIVGLILKEAKELSDYLKDVHGIEPAAGGGVVMALWGRLHATPEYRYTYWHQDERMFPRSHQHELLLSLTF